MKKIYFIFVTLLGACSLNAQVVISQVYGGGGNSGATYTHDFIELFNRGNTVATLSGYTLQYASATGTFSATNRQTLPDITLQPGQYFLIQQAQGNGGTTPLPAPDLVPTEAANNVILALSGTNGKVVLASNTTLVTSVADANVVDFVGYGTANLFEGAAATPSLTNSTAALRNNDGCQDTNNNSVDFITAAPAPRNSSTPLHLCGTAGIEDLNASGVILYPNPLSGNVLHIASASNAEKAVAIYDVLGKQVVNTVTTKSVNVSGLNSGVYVVKITEEGKTATKKLVIK